LKGDRVDEEAIKWFVKPTMSLWEELVFSTVTFLWSSIDGTEYFLQASSFWKELQ
jgi:hypothetical protein